MATTRHTLCTHPGSVLEQMFREGGTAVRQPDGSYHIDANPAIFQDHILGYLRNVGHYLGLGPGLLHAQVAEEFRRWGLPEPPINPNWPQHDAIPESYRESGSPTTTAPQPTTAAAEPPANRNDSDVVRLSVWGAKKQKRTGGDFVPSRECNRESGGLESVGGDTVDRKNVRDDVGVSVGGEREKTKEDEGKGEGTKRSVAEGDSVRLSVWGKRSQ
eukprot:comp18271_c1_seq1/m.19285 comp18271_c1_seq1/g.19285  ORF comp18271_c1_seq1/g.19285 comp18271_c1_seq1/m.19285 type:complete len:216 (-) comp18271_c1_seq1:99-746(-)